MMKTLSFANKNNVIVVGSLRCLIADFADDFVANCHNTLLICLGNVGLGRGNISLQNMELEYLERICQSNDNIVCFLRGNFDNPLYFNTVSRLEYFKGLSDYLKNVCFVEDYDVIATSKGNILCIGGGTDPRTPDGYVFLDPTSAVVDGAPHDQAWFKGQEIEKITLEPSIEKVEKEDGTIEEVDHNMFNNWAKMSKITMVMSSLPPERVQTTCLEGIENVNAYIERTFLSMMVQHLKELGCQIKTWYWCTDNYVLKDAEDDGVVFEGITNYTSKEIA